MYQKILAIILFGLISLNGQFIRDDNKSIVIDTELNLMWQDDSAAKTTSRNWAYAIIYCKDELKLGGYDDWRLPELYELWTIVDSSNFPTIKNEFKNTAPEYYKSSSVGGATYRNGNIDFENAHENYGLKDTFQNVRCVRTISSEPKINVISYTGEAKPFEVLYFSVNYELNETKNLQSIMFDYKNDGNWTTSDNYSFDKEGLYTIKVKVTDNSYNYSVKSLVIAIKSLEFDQMTPEQKLVKAIDPIYYDEIMTIIANEKESSRQSAITVGENNVLLDPSAYNLVSKTKYNTDIADINTTALATGVTQGKQYVQDNLSEFNLTTVATMNTAVSDAILQEQQNILANPEAYGI
ncbi:MAG: DUF1566 domain-containing protein, partial [Campylobacterales bacterium]|nr:DUF1566 domain-containing protein [Campylobacterales bacterium]